MYERGEREPGIETLEAFADCFNVDMDFLLGRSDGIANAFITPHEQTHIDKYRLIDDHGKRLVDTITEYQYERCYLDL